MVWLLLIGCFLDSILLGARAQIRVLAPENLVSQYHTTRGRIDGSTATFGAPFYGDRVLGQLVYGRSLKNHSHCIQEDYEVPDPDSYQHQSGDSSYSEVKLINIIMVRRGKCSFTTKVRVAMEKGAHAVIIVDKEESDMTSKDLKNIIVADDSFGNRIHIPSVLISKQDGKRLIQAVETSSKVVVELAWDLPTDLVVTTDMWMSSASQESFKFLKEFSAKRKTLNKVVIFMPHYAVFSVDGTDPNVYNDLCSDSSGKYCAEDPDGPGPITGKMVLDEDVRQLCIHELNKVSRSSLQDMKNGRAPVEYAQKYWDYVEKFLDRCPIEGGSPTERFGEECSHKLMMEVGIDIPATKQCMDNTRDSKLKFERENPAWSPRALRINGWRYSGILDADLVTRAICSAFTTTPQECKDTIKPRDPFGKYNGGTEEVAVDGVTFGQLLFWLGATVFFGFCLMLLYKRYLKKEMRSTLREEVMLEVQAQMGEYSKMQG